MVLVLIANHFYTGKKNEFLLFNKQYNLYLGTTDYLKMAQGKKLRVIKKNSVNKHLITWKALAPMENDC